MSAFGGILSIFIDDGGPIYLLIFYYFQYNYERMSQIYKSKHHDSEEEQEQRAYIEVNDNKTKKQILKKQQQTGIKMVVLCSSDGIPVLKQTPKTLQKLIVVEPVLSNIQEKTKKSNNVEKGENQKKEVKAGLKETKKRRVVEDDREKIKVKQVVRQQQNKPVNDRNKQYVESNKNIKRQPQTKSNVDYDDQEEDEEEYISQAKKVRYMMKQEDVRKPKAQLPQKKFIQKNIGKVRSQQQVKNGQKITVEVIQNKRQYDDQIYINKKVVDDYVQLAKDLLSKFDRIVLIAFGYYVAKAFQVAGILQREMSSLHQNSMPSIIRVKQTTKIGSKELNRALIEIQLSLDYLDSKQIGYQKSAVRPTEKYESKPSNKNTAPKYIEKQTSGKQKVYEKEYSKNEKGWYKNEKRGHKYEFNDKPKEVDERQLR